MNFKKTIVATLIGTMLMNMTPVNTYAAENTLTGKTANEIVSMMGKGWNLGNTFDATGGDKNDIYSHETAWGNPKVVRELIDGVKAAGLNTIRIPITWADYIDTNNGYAIYPEYMARVKEVVDYAMDADLFVIINVHHEEWVNRKDFEKEYEEIGKELVAVWKQVSDTFADYDQHLIFEGMNEPRAKETAYEWSGNGKCYDAVNYLDQLFVETVRGNGKGYNSERMLMVPGYAASSNPAVLKSIILPKINGETASNLCVSVHCYSPYEFCLQDEQTTFDSKNSGDTADIRTLFSNLDKLFISNGIPVVLGECGATNSGNNNTARLEWFAFMGNISAQYGVPAVIWDNGVNGTSGGECHYYFDRNTGEAYAGDLIEAFITGEVSLKAEDVSINFEPESDGSHSSLVEPSDLGFSSKVYTQMKVNHTEGVPMGFSLRVDSEAPDFTTEYNISRFKGHTIRIGAWIYSEDNATVSVLINNSENSTEMANISASTDWTSFCFDVEVQKDGDCSLLIKGSDKFFIDDFSIEMDPAEPLPQPENKEEIVNDESNDSPLQTGSVETSVEKTESASSNNTPFVIGILLIAAAAVIVIFTVRKKKKNNK